MSICDQVGTGEVPVPPEFQEVGSLLLCLIVVNFVASVDETLTTPLVQEVFVVRLTCLLWEFHTLSVSLVWPVVPFREQTNKYSSKIWCMRIKSLSFFSTLTIGGVNSVFFKGFSYTNLVSTRYW